MTFFRDFASFRLGATLDALQLHSITAARGHRGGRVRGSEGETNFVRAPNHDDFVCAAFKKRKKTEKTLVRERNILSTTISAGA